MLNIVLAPLVVAVGAYVALGTPRHFIVFLLAAGTLRFGAGDMPGGMNLSAYWLACLIGLMLVALVRMETLPWRISRLEILHATFLAWCAFELLRSASPEFGLRVFLKLVYPFLVMLLAHRSMLSPAEYRSAVKLILTASFLVSLLAGGVTQRFVGVVTFRASWAFWTYAAFADHAALMTVLALVAWRLFGHNRYLLLALWFALSSPMAGIRTGIGASAIGATVFTLITAKKVVALPFIFGIYLAAAVSLFVLPGAKEYMFRSPADVDVQDTIVRPHTALGEVADHGRFAIWEDVLDRFFWPSPALGSGLGATQAWFYSEKRPIVVEHSDYVRLLADTGVVGLLLFVATVVFCMAGGYRAYVSEPHTTYGLCGLLTVCAYPALLFCMGFDNIMNYVLPAGQYPFAFTGLMLGLRQRQIAEERVPARYPKMASVSFQARPGVAPGSYRTVL